MLSDKRMTIGLAATVGVLLVLLIAVEIMNGSGVLAQVPPSGPGGGSTMAMIIGEAAPNQDQPMFVVDSRNETICVYSFNAGTHKFGLKAARSYKYDKEIEVYNNEKPAVKDVKGGRLGRTGK